MQLKPKIMGAVRLSLSKRSTIRRPTTVLFYGDSETKEGGKGESSFKAIGILNLIQESNRLVISL